MISINPDIVVNHSWKELQAMLKTTNADCKAPTPFTLSGNHDSNFFSFCNGKLETSYLLRLNLDRRPEFIGMDEADCHLNVLLLPKCPLLKFAKQVLLGNQKCTATRSSSCGQDLHHGFDNARKTKEVEHAQTAHVQKRLNRTSYL
jgi:hypothetical protein